MPPKARITREMVIEAAFEIARAEGAECINARTVAARLGCSTQPVMYHFKTIEDLKRAVYERADALHSKRLSQMYSEDPMKDMGLNYIRFAHEEKQLFRLLFQSGSFSGKSIIDLLDDQALQPMLEMLSAQAEISMQQAKNVFRAVFICVHGYASLFANNDIDCDEASIADDLDLVFIGAIGAIKEGSIL